MIPFIQARNITLVFSPKNREPVTALKDFNVEVAKGEFVSIVGPSGCGKSTFLNILLRLIKPDFGEMKLDGAPIIGPGQERAMVFQEFGLLPWRTVQANVAGKGRHRLPRGMSVRPEHRMVAHTGFITVARRLAQKA